MLSRSVLLHFLVFPHVTYRHRERTQDSMMGVGNDILTVWFWGVLSLRKWAIGARLLGGSGGY